MLETLLNIDTALFHFINGTISNPITDFLMPIITSFTYWTPVYVLGIIYLLTRYKLKGFYILLILLTIVGICDYINAQLFKEYFGRLRPCKTLDDVNLLVSCGSGKSFPSNHAINNFSAATVLSFFFVRKRLALYFAASLVALSRVFVGVHYPLDILAGAIIGIAIAELLLLGIRFLPYTQIVKEKIRFS